MRRRFPTHVILAVIIWNHRYLKRVIPFKQSQSVNQSNYFFVLFCFVLEGKDDHVKVVSRFESSVLVLVIVSKLLTGGQSHDGTGVWFVGDVFVGDDAERPAQTDVRDFGRRVADLATIAAADVELQRHRTTIELGIINI